LRAAQELATEVLDTARQIKKLYDDYHVILDSSKEMKSALEELAE